MTFEVDKKLKNFQEAVKQIIVKAKEDGMITEEEKELIRVAEENLSEFEKMVELALEDDIITQEERNILIDLEEKMMSDTYYKAIEDTVIDKDEMVMLKTLYHTLNPRQSLDWLNEDEKQK